MMANDPVYRAQYERASEEEKRRLETGMPGPIGDRNDDVSRLARNTNSAQDMTMSVDNKSKSDQSNSASNQKDLEAKRYSDRDRYVREKAEESAKEKHDNRDKVDKPRYDQRMDPYSAMHGDKLARDPQEQLRAQMFQQQALIKQQKLGDPKKLEGQSSRFDSRAGDNNSASAKVSSSGSSKNDKSKDHTDTHLKSHEIKREPRDHDNSDQRSAGEDKSSHRSSSSSPFLDRNRNPDSAKSKQQQHSPMIRKVSSPQTIPQGMSANLSSHGIPVSSTAPANYNANYMYGQYMAPQYGHGGFEPNHPMFHNMNPSMMYAGSNYLHPAAGQLPYRVGMEMDDKDKMSQKMAHGPEPESGNKMLGSPHSVVSAGHHLNNSSNSALNTSSPAGSHKIHELQDKNARPLSSPHRSSPLPAKATTPVGAVLDKNREFANSPPTQRHVHTHHHTHVVEAAYPVYPYSGKLHTLPPVNCKVLCICG